MIVALALVLLAQLAGEALARGSGLAVPGPVLGAALMVGLLALRDARPALSARWLPGPLVDGGLERTGRGLLAHLSLMFVPAGVGIVGRLDALAEHALALAAVLVLSVVATLAVTALTFAAVSRRVRLPDEAGADGP